MVMQCNASDCITGFGIYRDKCRWLDFSFMITLQKKIFMLPSFLSWKKAAFKQESNWGYYVYDIKQYPLNRFNKKQEKYFADILSEVKPDIIQLFGSEYASALIMMNACIKWDIKTVLYYIFKDLYPSIKNISLVYYLQE